MKNCPSCGCEAPDVSRACPACGATLDGATASFPAVAPPVQEQSEHVEIDSDGPVLVVRKGPEVGERFYLDRPRLVIGRDPECDIFLSDVTVSRQHAVLEVGDAGVTIRDAGSLNGTYVNGVSVDSAPLGNGDTVQVGKFQMIVLTGGGR
ncbi:MAG: FHA domain-containing protein [Coriobacteriia bacterium]